jgi:hypothetical protein
MLCIDVFEHIEDYMGFLRALRPKAKWTIFHIPLNLSSQAVLRGTPILYGRKKLGHLHYFFKDTAIATLTDVGYVVLDHCYTAGAIDRGGSTLKNRLARLPRRFLYSIDPDLAVRALGGYSLLVLTSSSLPGSEPPATVHPVVQA